MEQILLYTKNNGKRAQIEELCAMMNIDCHQVTWQEISLPIIRIGQKQKGPKAKNSAAFQIPALYDQPEILLMRGLADDTLDNFLDFYRIRGIEPIALKAVITPYNFGMSIYELTKELQKEDAYFKKEGGNK